MSSPRLDLAFFNARARLFISYEKIIISSTTLSVIVVYDDYFTRLGYTCHMEFSYPFRLRFKLLPGGIEKFKTDCSNIFEHLYERASLDTQKKKLSDQNIDWQTDIDDLNSHKPHSFPIESPLEHRKDAFGKKNAKFKEDAKNFLIETFTTMSIFQWSLEFHRLPAVLIHLIADYYVGHDIQTQFDLFINTDQSIIKLPERKLGDSKLLVPLCKKIAKSIDRGHRLNCLLLNNVIPDAIRAYENDQKTFHIELSQAHAKIIGFETDENVDVLLFLRHMFEGVAFPNIRSLPPLSHFLRLCQDVLFLTPRHENKTKLLYNDMRNLYLQVHEIIEQNEYKRDIFYLDTNTILALYTSAHIRQLNESKCVTDVLLLDYDKTPIQFSKKLAMSGINISNLHLQFNDKEDCLVTMDNGNYKKIVNICKTPNILEKGILLKKCIEGSKSLKKVDVLERKGFSFWKSKNHTSYQEILCLLIKKMINTDFSNLQQVTHFVDHIKGLERLYKLTDKNFKRLLSTLLEKLIDAHRLDADVPSRKMGHKG
jgi:hypothetical protein